MQFDFGNNQPYVSFCISAYKRTDITLELVKEILSSKDKRFEIVICDDCSDDGGLERYKKITDERLRVYENSKNLGGYLNICEALDKGRGKYLFYLNDRDNFDIFKINKFISLIPLFIERDVTFGRCISDCFVNKDFELFTKGEDAILEFGCRVTHPSGYIFEREEWHNTSRRDFFESQDYGDYAFTMICALQARNHNGAIVFGDLCDVKRLRIDFGKEKSRFNKYRNDKSLWYSPEAHIRELKALLKFSEEYLFEKEVEKKLFLKRYKEYLIRITVGLKEELKQEANTVHYGIKPPKSNLQIVIQIISNRLHFYKLTKELIKKSELLQSIEGNIYEIQKTQRKENYEYIKKEFIDWISGCGYRWNNKYKAVQDLEKWHRGYQWKK